MLRLVDRGHDGRSARHQEFTLPCFTTCVGQTPKQGREKTIDRRAGHGMH